MKEGKISAVKDKPTPIFAKAIFFHPFFVVKSSELVLLYHSPANNEYLPYGVQKALDLIPLVGSGADIFRTNTFCVFGKYVWSPYLLIAVPVLVGVLCLPVYTLTV